MKLTKFLKPRNIHRLIIGLVLLAPIVYLFGTWFAYLMGAHGQASAPSFGSMFDGNFLAMIGMRIRASSEQGFTPVADLIRYIDSNVLHLFLVDTDGLYTVAMTSYGYIYYVCNVLILDLIAMAFVFIITIPHKLLDWFNGHAGGDW